MDKVNCVKYMFVIESHTVSLDEAPHYSNITPLTLATVILILVLLILRVMCGLKRGLSN